MILKTSRSNLSSNDQLALDLPFAATKSLTARVGPTPTFTRGSGATYIGSDGLIHGVDTSTTSNTIGTGSRTFTLAATAGQDQLWRTGDAVEASNGSNSMVGTVTSYTPSTQVLVCNMTSIGGSGTFTSWRIGYRGPRFDHTSAGVCRGLLIEEGSENLFIHSSDISSWNAATRVGLNTSGSYLNVTTAPDGTSTADKIVEDASTGQHGLGMSNVAITALSNYTFSFYAKAAERSIISVFDGGYTSLVAAHFNLSSGVSTINTPSGFSGRMTPAGDGWYRCVVTYPPPSGSAGTQSFARLRINKDGSLGFTSASITYTGDNTSGLYVWGTQFEQKAFPTSYIPTTTASVVRSADVCSYTDVSSFYNPEAGTLVGDLILYTPSPLNTTEFFRFGAGNNRIQLGVTNTANEGIRPFIISGGTTTYNSTQGTTVAGTSRKVALTFATNDAISCLNGTLGTQDTSVTMPVSISTAAIGAGALTGHLAFVRYYKKRLPNAKLQALTA